MRVKKRKSESEPWNCCENNFGLSVDYRRTWEDGGAAEACCQDWAVSVGVAENVRVDTGVGLEVDDKPEVGQVHPGRDLAALVSRLQQQMTRMYEVYERKQVELQYQSKV